MSALRHRRWLLMFSIFILARGTMVIADDDVPKFAPPAPIDTGSPGKMPVNDRKQSQAMAKAMALGAMSMQMVMCMKMMQEAMKKEGSEKTQMMMMAMMMCQQAAESAKNAAENDKGEKKMSEPAKGPTMKTPEFKMAGKGKGDDKLMKGLENKKVEEGEEPMPPEIPEIATQIPEFQAPEPPSQEAVEAEVAMGEAFVPVTSVPNRIERAKIGYDESGKSGLGLTPDRALGNGSSVATSKPGAKGEGDNAKNEFVPNNFNVTRRGRGIEEGAAAGSSDGSSISANSSDNEGGSNPMDAIMALLNGTPQEEAVRPGSDILTANQSSESTKQGPNIFEYASYRYKKSAFEERRVRTRSTKHASTRREEATVAQAPVVVTP